MSADLPPLGPHDHPEPQAMVWSELEVRAIRTIAARALAAQTAEWRRECDDTDTILRALGLDPAKCRTDGGSLKVQMIVRALANREAMLICEAGPHKDRVDDCGRLARMVLGKVNQSLQWKQP